MRGTISISLILILVPPSFLNAQETEFSTDNAYAILKTLVEYYGPRPMGSPAEQAALVFAVSKLGQYGCQESYVMPMAVADGVNTKSGIAVGILRGKTNRIIVIGGHIDTSAPEVPGANDDASGVACVIELARVLGKRQNESTIVFCCWGGEEEGLRGSKYFADHFTEIDSVALMIQIDMADGASALLIDPDGNGTSAPTWLPRAAYDVFYHDLHYADLIYPTHGATLNWALGGATGSDHESFLAKGIPAICFTSDVNYPIHTIQDNLENFTPSGLKRTGDLVLKLFDRFDHDVPPRSTDKYLLIRIGVAPFFLPYWLLWLSIVLSMLIGWTTLVGVRRRRDQTTNVKNIKWSGMKILLCAFVVQVFIWFSENLVGLMNSYRFPWVNNFDGFSVLGILSGLIGLWFMLRLFRFSTDAYVYTRVAFIVLAAFILLMSFGGPKLAMYPASGLFFFSLAMRTQNRLLKLLFLLAAPCLMIRLFFPEFLGLIQRLLASNTIDSLAGNIGYNLAFVFFFWLLSLPFAYAFAAVYRSTNADLFWLKRFRTIPALILVLLAATSLSVYLSSRPVYGRDWFSLVRVNQEYSIGSDSSSITLKGSEYLKGVHMWLDGEQSVFEERTNFSKLHPARSTSVNWCSISVFNAKLDDISGADSLNRIERRIEVRSKFRPLRVSMVFRSTEPIEVTSPWSHGSYRRTERETSTMKTFSWYSFPDTPLVVPVTFALRDSQTVIERIEVTYDSLAYPIALGRVHTNFIKRTTVSSQDTFGVSHHLQPSVASTP